MLVVNPLLIIVSIVKVILFKTLLPEPVFLSHPATLLLWPDWTTLDARRTAQV